MSVVTASSAAVVTGSIIEPTSKLDSLWGLTEVGVDARHTPP